MTNIYLQMMREVYPHFKDCLIQTFDDNKWRKDLKLAKIINQNNYTDEQMDWILERANQKWCWIFFSVNSMNGLTRNKESITNINAWACEVDDKPKEEQMKLIWLCPLKPSLIIESQKSYHMYWFAKDGTKENWNKICWGLCNFFWGDVAIPKNEAVVLRVPGFKHLKNPDKPFDLAIIDWNKKYYTEEEMLTAYSNITTDADRAEQKRKIELENQKLKKLLDNDDTRERINSMDAMTMLSEISGSSMVRWEVFDFKKNSDGSYQIVVNWETHWSWIDKIGKIWSYTRWGPSWVCWVLWYEVYTAKDIYQWVKEHHPEVLPEKRKNENKIIPQTEMTDEEIEEWTHLIISQEKKWFLYPSDKFNAFEGFMSWDLVTIIAPSNSGKTTLALDIIKRNAKLGRKWMYINLEFEIATVPRSRWMWAHWKNKMDLTDLGTMSEEEKTDMDNYIKSYLSEFDYYNNPNGLELDKLVSLIRKKTEEWYELFVIDTFSKILGNLNSDTARTNQNRCMEVFQSLVQELNIAVVMLHHTNRQGTWEGSQKIMDLSNVFITIEKSDDWTWIPSRIYRLMKDKYTPDKEIELWYNVKTWEYLSDVSEVIQAQKSF